LVHIDDLHPHEEVLTDRADKLKNYVRDPWILQETLGFKGINPGDDVLILFSPWLIHRDWGIYWDGRCVFLSVLDQHKDLPVKILPAIIIDSQYDS